jgi:hypothetical protein
MFSKDKISSEEKEAVIAESEAQFDPTKDMPK